MKKRIKQLVSHMILSDIMSKGQLAKINKAVNGNELNYLIAISDALNGKYYQYLYVQNLGYIDYLFLH